jgi:hypothetical protein
MAELTLNDDERYAFVSHLHGVCVTKLMRREPATHPGPHSRACQLLARRA